MLGAGVKSVTAEPNTERQDLKAVEAAAEEFLAQRLRSGKHERVEVTTGALDDRLRLDACPGELEAFLPHGRDPSRASTVGVRCTDEAPWTVYVTVRSQVFAEVLVARRGLSRGNRIDPEDLKTESRDVSRERGGWLQDPEQLEGMQVRRTIRRGDVLTMNHVEEPRLVTRGSRVVIEATQGERVRITSRGEALEHGNRGDRVRVRNLDSNREIEGRVVGPDRVEVVF